MRSTTTKDIFGHSPWVSPTATSFDPVGVGTIPECTASVGFTLGYFIRPRRGRHDPGMHRVRGFHPRLFHSTPLGSARSRNGILFWFLPDEHDAVANGQTYIVDSWI